MKRGAQPCRHCRTRSANSWRGMCGVCYCTPSIRALYPKEARKTDSLGVIGCGNHARPLPAYATDARPGTPEKVTVLIRRAAANEALFHPNDYQSELPEWMLRKICST